MSLRKVNVTITVNVILKWMMTLRRVATMVTKTAL